MKLKLFSWLLVLLSITSIALAVDGQVTNFNGQSNPFIDTITNIGKIYYFNLPSFVYPKTNLSFTIINTQFNLTLNATDGFDSRDLDLLGLKPEIPIIPTSINSTLLTDNGWNKSIGDNNAIYSLSNPEYGTISIYTSAQNIMLGIANSSFTGTIHVDLFDNNDSSSLYPTIFDLNGNEDKIGVLSGAYTENYGFSNNTGDFFCDENTIPRAVFTWIPIVWAWNNTNDTIRTYINGKLCHVFRNRTGFYKIYPFRIGDGGSAYWDSFYMTNGANVSSGFYTLHYTIPKVKINFNFSDVAYNQIELNEQNISHKINISQNSLITLLKNKCSCKDCIISSSNCLIPLNISTNISLSTEFLAELLTFNYSYGINNCSNSFGIQSNATSLNISVLDSSSAYTKVNLSNTVFYSGDITNLSNNYSLSRMDATNISYCIYPNWSDLYANWQFYYTDASANNYNYFTYLFNMTNNTQKINLYTQAGTTLVQFTILDSNSNPVPNAYLYILKYDVGTNSYTTTEILKTDSQGQAFGNIVLITDYYNFLVYLNGELVGSEIGVRLSTTTRTIYLTEGLGTWYSNFQTTLGVSTALTFNNFTNNFAYTWSDATGGVHYACLKVLKTNITSQYNLSDICSLSTSGTILYNIVSANDTTYKAIGYLKYDNIFITDILEKVFGVSYSQGFEKDKFGSLFIGWLILLAAFFIGLPNPVNSLILLDGAIILNLVLDLWRLTPVSGGTIIALSIIIIYLIGRQTE